MGLEDSSARMTRIGKAELVPGGVLSIDESLARIDAVTLDDVHAVAATCCDAETLAVLGPAKALSRVPDPSLRGVCLGTEAGCSVPRQIPVGRGALPWSQRPLRFRLYAGRGGMEQMKHRLPKPADLAPLIRFKKPVLNPVQRRLANSHTIEDLRRVARRTTPRAAFDYTDGAAEHELSLSRARQAFRDVELHPAILRDVSKVELGRDVLGRRGGFPSGSHRPVSPGSCTPRARSRRHCRG